MSGIAWNSAMSWPTQNPRPAPVTTTARTSGARAAFSAAARPACIASLNALRTSGRFSVIVWTAPWRLTSTSATRRSLPVQLPPHPLGARGPPADRANRGVALVGQPAERTSSRPPEPGRECPQRQQAGQCDDLAAEDDRVHVDRRPPLHLFAVDREDADRPGCETEAAACLLALAALVVSAAGPAEHLRDRDQRQAVPVERLAEHALHLQRVLRL